MNVSFADKDTGVVSLIMNRQISNPISYAGRRYRNAVTIGVKRVYAPAQRSDGFRILVDRLWPRGVSKQDARVDLWIKDAAPDTQLRKWYGHRPERWSVFKQCYMKQLNDNRDTIAKLTQIVSEKHTVTLLYAARDEERNHAVVLRDYITEALDNVALNAAGFHERKRL